MTKGTTEKHLGKVLEKRNGPDYMRWATARLEKVGITRRMVDEYYMGKRKLQGKWKSDYL